MTEEKNLTVAEAIPIASATSDVMALPLSAEMVRRQMGIVQSIIKDALVDGLHYGTVPGVAKEFLYQAGAEKLAMTFHLRAEYEVVSEVEREGDGVTSLGFLSFTVRCKLLHQGTGRVIGEAMGNCNSRERKYKERQVYPDRVSETEKKIGRLEERKKRNGGSYSVWMVPVDPYEIYHTILSMAQKRAFTRAVRAALAASDALGVDEEMATILMGENEAETHMAPEDTQRASELRDKAKAANSASGLADALREAAGLSRQWSGLPGNADPAFLRLVGLTTAGRTEKPQEMTLVEVSSIIDTMKRDLKTAGVEV